MSYPVDEFTARIQSAFWHRRLGQDAELLAHLEGCRICQAALVVAELEHQAARRHAAERLDEISAYLGGVADALTTRRLLRSMADSPAFAAEVESMRTLVEAPAPPVSRARNPALYLVAAAASIVAFVLGTLMTDTEGTGPRGIDGPELIARGSTTFQVLLQRGSAERACDAGAAERCTWDPSRERIWVRYQLDESKPFDRLAVYGIDAKGLLLDLHPRQGEDGAIDWSSATSTPSRCDALGCFPMSPASSFDDVPDGPVLIIALFSSSTEPATEVHHVVLEAVSR